LLPPSPSKFLYYWWHEWHLKWQKFPRLSNEGLKITKLWVLLLCKLIIPS
jgi:hypothetical protein